MGSDPGACCQFVVEVPSVDGVEGVFVGEDGPTHQPIEHLMSMRLIPNLWVVRPADAIETNTSWKMALLRKDGPTAICLSRQGLPIIDRTKMQSLGTADKGAYILSKTPEASINLIASGSEVTLALAVKEKLANMAIHANVISMLCIKKFMGEDKAYREQIVNPAHFNLTIEAGTTYGWSDLLGVTCHGIGINRFGASAPGQVVAAKLGLNVDNIVTYITTALDLK